MAPHVAPLLAHSWGWDELLMFAVPIVLALGAVRIVEKRAAERREAGAATGRGEADAEGEGTAARTGDQDAGEAG